MALHFHSEHGREGFADVRWRFRDLEAGRFHGGYFLFCRALAAGNDCAGVAHAASGRRCLSGDKSNDRLLHVRADELRCGLFRVAANLPDHYDGFRLRIAIKQVEGIDKICADNRIAPDADCRRLPERDTIPTLPSLWMDAGMMPILHLPGEMMPGQLGPISRERRFCRNSHARTMSSVGMPSVMQTISSISASAASMIASAAYGGGTKITVAFAPVLSAASCTVLKIGQPSCVVPPLPGVMPPTICVP